LQPVDQDINALVRRVLDLLGRTLGERIDVRADLAPDLAPVHIDPSQLESALLNLAVNARDAMPEGGVLTIRTRNMASEGANEPAGTPDRGRFVFIDCLVRNRAAIAEPWREFRQEGNRFFVFLLVLMLLSLVLVALFGGLIFGLFVLWRNYRVSNVPALFVVVPIVVFAWVAFAVVVNLITYFMPPVMYTRRCSPVDAARAILQLLFDDPAPFILFILLMIGFWIGWIMLGCFVTCATCCLASLPYIGTVIVLPVPVFFRSFSLLFLRQFGPDYDVWAGFMPPEFSPVLLPPPVPAGTEAS